MNVSRNALMLLLCIMAANLAAGVVDIKTTGTNTATGVATVQGDVFILQPDEYGEYSLYSGVWAHVYVPSGNDGTNAGVSERTADARDDTRNVAPAGSLNSYSLTNSYGDSTVIAKASKTGVLGSAEAFSEVSAESVAYDSGSIDAGRTYGISALTAYLSHSGTGTANASAEGSSEYEALMNNGVVQAGGSVDGEVALNAANNYGGAGTGAAFDVSTSDSSTTSNPYSDSESFEYLSLQSGRNALSAVSAIYGSVSGDGSGSGFTALSGTPGVYAISQSSIKGDMSATASTYQLGDLITPGAITTPTIYSDMRTQLDSLPANEKGANTPLYEKILAGTPKASAYLLSHSGSSYSDSSDAEIESFTSASAIRTMANENEAYGASYISNGALSTATYASSAPGMSPVTLASADVDGIFMGSGAHLVSRLTGAQLASTADLTVKSSMSAAAAGSVKVTGDSQKKLVKVVGPSYSSSGTSADAAGSYLTAEKISGTAVHIADPTFTAASNFIADDIDSISIWSWASGDDPISHAESSEGLSPFVSTPSYTSDPAGAAGVTEGPTVTSGATATSRSIDTVFSSSI